MTSSEGPEAPSVQSTPSEAPTDGPTSHPLKSRVEALDGFRGVAALLVVAHHLVADFLYAGEGWQSTFGSWTPAGFLGVDVFFVMSGFLVATLAIEAQSRGGRWRGDFYQRRVVRLIPALLGLCIVHVIYSRIMGWSGRAELNNWVRVFTGTFNIPTVFGDFTPATGLVPMWTLAIEWQFYLVFPLVLALLPRRRPHVGTVVFGVAVLVIAVWRAHLFDSGTFIVDLFVRTDTRGDAILMGVVFAFAWPTIRRLPRRGHAAAGWVGLIGFTWIYLQADFYGAFLYRGGFTLVAVLVAAILPSLLTGTGPAAIFRTRPLRAAGLISYSLYIWHSFVFSIVGRYLSDLPRTVQAGIAVLASLAVAQLSWVLIEQPVSRYFRRRGEERAVGENRCDSAGV